MSNKKIYDTNNLTDAISGDIEEANEREQEGKKAGKSKGFRRDLVILIFSFLIAMSIWVFVKGTEDGEYEKTISLIPVQIVGANELEYNSNMSVISGYDNTVNVVLKGKRSDVNKYNASDIYAYVDVSKIDNSDRQMLTVTIDPLPNITITTISPSAIAVYADVIGSKEVDVVVKPYYTIDGAYFIDNDKITKSIDTVVVTGPMSVLETVDSAVAETNIGKLTGSVKSTTSVYLVDNKGGKIQNPYLKVNQDMVEINIPVYLKKYITLTYEYDEKMFEGYDVNIELEFENVYVIGEVLKVSNLNTVCVLSLTRSHFKQDSDGNYLPYETNAAIKLPEGVRVEGDVSSVYIKAEITKKVADTPATGGDTTTAVPEAPETPEA